MANEDKSSYWTLLWVIVGIAYIWFVLVLFILLDVDRCLNRFPAIQRLLSLVNSGYLPFFGNTMFLPIIALLYDPFVCVEHAQGSDFVARDCY
jgi:threonine/homoserine/homoserine lactone efflux protein